MEEKKKREREEKREKEEGRKEGRWEIHRLMWAAFVESTSGFHLATTASNFCSAITL